MTAVSPAPTTGGRIMSVRRSVLVLGALEAFGPLSMDLYMPTLPQLAASLDTSDALAQATMSVCMIGLGLGQLVAGPLSDRFGRRRPLLIGIALFALFSLACVFAPTIELLLLARLMQGLAGSAGVVISLAIARDLYSGAELSRMLSLLIVVGATAPIVAPIVGGQLALFMDWRGIFGVLACVGVAIFVLAFAGLRETLPTENRHSGGFRTTTSHVRLLSRDRLFLMILIASAAAGVAFFSYLSMSSFVLQDEFGLSPQQFSLLFAVNALANMAGSQLSRLVVRRHGPARTYLTGQAVAAVSAVGLLVVVLAGGGVLAVLIALCLFLFSAGIGGPNGTTLALGGHAERAGTASALLGTAMFVAGPVIAPLAALGGATALAMSMTIAIATVISATLAWTIVRSLLRRQSLDPMRT
ncbi:DHA1 family bicyclomycin/chloramphenicol resistance-like MFS transporter [Microterricola gilva]|uniref:DHA1 family bicyclomycin/chloramphenicol resistance-like MFS transporter n=1 Tax=Microterricola gilva TaxID=393267 RepID=A0A4Q8ANQ5_9MICO|nr:multidrug effflux MFS transporter [Microterricola gilva]RZU66254.1 DHA1 family bicyclomycin/chloramphenicol resistance-like MFS transporter [Microterricola gilva]